MVTTDDDGDPSSCQIFSSSNTSQVLFSTDNLPSFNNYPTNVGSVISLPGGGTYYVGTTQLGISGA
jgi:hypothetical protein